VSLLIWFMFSPLLAGLVPTAGPVSWEMHLAGFVLGIVLAVIYRDWDRPPVKRYAWENESDDDDDFDTLLRRHDLEPRDLDR
jgi:hypothetical protein